ncbi:hypothetical protein [Denitromonas sp.]|uniref:hypothetical protein n=1 Tax=Denitromonas sp. TaxID=2734609 RepID=UPI003A8719F3
MKAIIISAIVAAVISGCVSGGGYRPVSDQLPSLTVAFADSAWTGNAIPNEGVCSNFGGKDMSPALKVSGIPAGANAIIIQFNDRDYGPLSSGGGHGTLGYWVTGTSATLPAVKGFGTDVPDGVFIEAPAYGTGAYRSPGYLAACSGGRGHTYEAVIKAVYKAKKSGEESRLLAESVLAIGRY